MNNCNRPIRRMDYGPECTRELVAEVAKQLATRSVRDSEFILADSVDEDDNVAIIQGGINKKVSLDTLSKGIENWLDIDQIKDKLSSLNIQYHTTAYWDSLKGYVPFAGEIIIYSDYQTVGSGSTKIDIPGIKIGSGNGYVQDLAFVGQTDMDAIVNHITNQAIHVTSEEKLFWNNKINVTDNREVIGEALVFNRN